MYTWYLPKGRSTRFQHRHFWETAVVWIDKHANEHSFVLGVSLNVGRKTNTYAPLAERYLDGSSVMLDSYHVQRSHRPTLQLTEDKGEFQDLITWEQLTEEARDALSTADFNNALFQNKARQMPLTDDHFDDRLEDAWPF